MIQTPLVRGQNDIAQISSWNNIAYIFIALVKHRGADHLILCMGGGLNYCF